MTRFGIDVQSSRRLLASADRWGGGAAALAARRSALRGVIYGAHGQFLQSVSEWESEEGGTRAGGRAGRVFHEGSRVVE